MKTALLFVKSGQLFTLTGGADNDFVPLDAIVVKSVERMPCFVKNEIGHIHHIVDRFDLNRFQGFFQPFRRFFHLQSADQQSAVVRTTLRVFNGQFDGQFRGLLRKSFHGW